MSQNLIVITGGASGIGAACVKYHLNKNDKVIVLDLPNLNSKKLMDSIGVTAFFSCDVSNSESLENVANEIENSFGKVSGLINSAGIIQQKKLSPDLLSINEWDQIFKVNLRGSYLCCAIFGSKMANAGTGAIVNIASITSFRSVPLHAYGPGKAAIIAITSNLATEWGRSGVRVNAVAPGFTLTEGLQKTINSGNRNIDDLCKQSAMGRLVETNEVASTVGFLLSKDSSGITGITIPVDAGWLCGSSWDSWGGIPEPKNIKT